MCVARYWWLTISELKRSVGREDEPMGWCDSLHVDILRLILDVAAVYDCQTTEDEKAFYGTYAEGRDMIGRWSGGRVVGDLDRDWNVRVGSWLEAFCEWRGLKSISYFIAVECW